MSKKSGHRQLAPKAGAQELHGTKASSLTVTQEYLAGPLPHPSILESYERVLPGIAERIVSMAEREQLQRHRTEDLILEAKVKDRHSYRTEVRLGQVFAMLIAIVGLGVAGYVATHGAPYVGGTIATTVVLSLVSAFLVGNRAQYRSRDSNDGSKEEHPTKSRSA